jgi:hypothetical protein
MRARFELPAIEPWPLAATVASSLSPNPWTVVAVPAERVEGEAAEIVDQLASLLEAPVELLRVESAQELIQAAEPRSKSALVLVGLDGLSPEAWRQVDANRSRLTRELPIVLVLDEARIATMREHAPNLWSWLGGSVWRGMPDEGLSEEQRRQRLSALQEHFGFDDAALIGRAEARELPPDPQFAEWLVLIGKGHLVQR